MSSNNIRVLLSGLVVEGRIRLESIFDNTIYLIVDLTTTSSTNMNEFRFKLIITNSNQAQFKLCLSLIRLNSD